MGVDEAEGEVGEEREEGAAPAERLRFALGDPCSSPGGPSGRPPDMAGKTGTAPRTAAQEQWGGNHRSATMN
eukprot:1343850-Alexandrium_andersonii.AAC.1